MLLTDEEMRTTKQLFTVAMLIKNDLFLPLYGKGKLKEPVV